MVRFELVAWGIKLQGAANKLEGGVVNIPIWGGRT